MTRRALVQSVLPPLVPLVVGTLLLELAVGMKWINGLIVPPPSAVAEALAKSPDLWRAAVDTSMASIAGFIASAIVGLVIAVGLSSSRWVQRAFYPYTVFFQTVPIVAIAPLLVIWIGWGIKTVITSAFIVSVFPVIANTLSGLLSTDPALRDLFRLYGASHAATLWKLRLPFALPNIMTGLRIAAGLAVIGAIVGEFITGGGLGGLIDVAKDQQKTEKIFAALILAAGLGIALFTLINLASRLALRHWHASEKEIE